MNTDAAADGPERFAAQILATDFTVRLLARRLGVTTALAADLRTLAKDVAGDLNETEAIAVSNALIEMADFIALADPQKSSGSHWQTLLK